MLFLFVFSTLKNLLSCRRECDLVIKRVLKRMIEKRGYKIIRSNLEHYDQLFAQEAIYCDEVDFSFNVPIVITVGNFGFSFGQDTHPFVITITNDILYKNNSYKNSTLKEFYSAFCPSNLQEAYSENSNFPFSTLRQYPPFLRLEPWRCSEILISGHDNGQGNQNFGPVSKEKGEYEFSRLRSLVESIMSNGYNPEKTCASNITGYFMRFNDEYRFRITDGVHRSSVLSALGYEKLKVQFDPKMPRVICYSDRHNWPKVKQGKIDIETAEKMFEAYFSTTRSICPK